MSAIWVCAHFPPRAVGMRRSFKAAAIWRRLFPSAFIGRMIGRTLAANRAAAALLLAIALLRASSILGLPSLVPRALAAARAARGALGDDAALLLRHGG